MSRVQLALNVAHLEQSVEFYSRLFGTGPAKIRPGYANFAIADPPLKLVLIQDATKSPSSLNHLGVEVDGVAEVSLAKDRLAGAGVATEVEDQVTCCYAVQDKVWAVGLTGRAGSSTRSWPTLRCRRAICALTTKTRRRVAPPPAKTQTAAQPLVVSRIGLRILATTDMMAQPLWRRLLAEFLGSAFLAAAVIGSGIAAQNLSPGAAGLELFENAAATAAGLFAIILMLGPISGGHFNPVVSFVDAAFGGLRWKEAVAYLPAQVAGCITGAVVANLMFAKAAVSISTKHRASGAHFFSEIAATLGLLLLIFALARTGRGHLAAAAVGAYIGAAYFFTSSTSFANPAITVGRMFSNTFAGIAPSSAPSFIGAQVVGGVVAVGAIKALYPRITPAEATNVVIPHASPDGTDKQSAVGPTEAPSLRT